MKTYPSFDVDRHKQPSQNNHDNKSLIKNKTKLVIAVYRVCNIRSANKCDVVALHQKDVYK